MYVLLIMWPAFCLCRECAKHASFAPIVVTAIAWHPIYETLFASGAADGSIMFWLVGYGVCSLLPIPNGWYVRTLQ